MYKVKCLKTNWDLKVKKNSIYEMKLICSLDKNKVFEYIDRDNKFNRLINLDKYIEDGVFEIV